MTPSLITIALGLVLALFTAALTDSAPSQARMSLTDGNFFVQETPTPQSGDRSISGSTDQIVIMGGVISAIIIVPILASRKTWR